MGELDLNCVASFLVLVERSNYGRAAAQLHITSSALTKHVQRLEKQLGVLLVVRDNSGVIALTPAGARFAKHARPLLGQARAAIRAASDRRVLAVRVGLAGVVGEYPTRSDLVSLGSDLRRCYPNARMTCRGFPIGDLIPALLARQVDVILTPRYADAVTTLAFSDLWTVQRLAVVDTQHTLAEASHVEAKDLCELPMLYDPTVPAHWMETFCLGDIRRLEDAHLVSVAAPNASAVFGEARRAAAVAISHDGHLPLRSGLRAIPIANAPAVTFVAARRALDQRELTLALVQLMGELRRSVRRISALDKAVEEPGGVSGGVVRARASS